MSRRAGRGKEGKERGHALPKQAQHDKATRPSTHQIHLTHNPSPPKKTRTSRSASRSVSVSPPPEDEARAPELEAEAAEAWWLRENVIGMGSMNGMGRL